MFVRVYPRDSLHGSYVFIHVFGSSLKLLVLCRQPAMWLWSGLVGLRAEAVEKLLGGSGSGVRERRGERLMASLKMSTFLRLPQRCPSERALLSNQNCLGQVVFFFFFSLSADWFAVPWRLVTEWWSGKKSDLILAAHSQQLVHSWPRLQRVSGDRLQMKRS